MTQHDTSLATQATRSTETEAIFEPHEMFHSRTDSRGVIVSGNQVFQRMSGYGWQELRGAPHKIIRHPDMPKGVFHLFWHRLKAGQRMVAYVKNKAKDGSYYWVLALSWPVDDGYLSIRVKPTSPLRAEMEELYVKLRVAERDEGLSPEASCERLLEMLKEKGHMDYDSFMAEALGAEMRALSKLTGVPMSAAQERFFSMQVIIEELGQEMDKLFDVMRGIRTVPMNMRILASRLENAGGPISAISVNYSQMLEEMSTWIKAFQDGPGSTYSRIHGSILSGKFTACASVIQNRMAAAFEDDISKDDGDTALVDERDRLQLEARNFDTKAQETLKSIESQVRRLSRSVLDMKRYVTGLSSSRMMCKIESATLGHSGSALTGIVEQLDQRQDEIEIHLAKVMELNTAVQGQIEVLRRGA